MAGLVLALLVPGVASATVFESVEAYEPVRQGSQYSITVTGVVQGETAAREVAFVTYWSSDYAVQSRAAERCEKLILLALSRPGRYLLHLQTTTYVDATVLSCKLVRR